MRNSVARLSQKTLSTDKEKPKKEDGSTYQSQEYFGYDQYTYFDIEKEMVKYRLPQPSSLPNIDYTWSKVPPKSK